MINKMKKPSLLIVLVLLMASAFGAQAQMSKQEEKDWQKRIKALQPEQYKALLEDNKRYQTELAAAKKELSTYDDKLDESESRIAKLDGQLESARLELQSANEKLRKASSGAGDGEGIYNEPGVVFRVQIGALLNKQDLAKYAAGNKNFNAETDNSVQKFTLGVFRDYWQADTFKKYLRKMGVKDAWIVAYKDGKRVPLKEVLSGII